MSPFYWERHPDGPFVTLIRGGDNVPAPGSYEMTFEA